VRVALITVAYPPLRSSAAVQMRDLACEFAAQGHEPVVLVPDANLDRPWAIDALDGIQVLRLRALPTRDVNYLWRTITEITLPWMMLRGLRKSPLGSQRWDAVAWYSPSIFFGPLVGALKRSSKCRSYLIQRDIFPEWAVDLGLLRRGLAYRIFKMVQRQQYEVADIIGVQAPSNLVYLAHLAAKPGLRLEVLWNWLAEARNIGCSIALDATPLAGRTIFVYAGNMGVAQGVDIFVDLAERLNHRRDIGFLFVGRGSELPRLRAAAVDRGINNILFRDEVDPKEIPGLLAQCDVGLLALDPRHRTHNIPGKFLAYVQAGLPVLARINANNDLAGLIESEGAGRVSVGATLDSLQVIAEELADDKLGRELMSSRGRDLARKLFSPTTAVRQIVAALQSMRNSSRGDPLGRYPS
jgi:glycosyltransferase involved in cell wall biosynthesis